MSDAIKPLPFKVKNEIFFDILSHRLMERLAFGCISNEEYNKKINNLKIDRLRFRLEQRKNRINQPDSDNVLDGKQGRISFKFKWLDSVEEKIKWHTWAYNLYKTIVNRRW